MHPYYQQLAVKLALLMVIAVEQQAKVVLRSAIGGTSGLAPNRTNLAIVGYFYAWSEQEISLFVTA